MRTALLALPLVLASSAAAPPTPVTVALANYRFEPAIIRLHHGQPYVLHLVNQSSRGHNFVAPHLPVAAGADRVAVEVPAGGIADLPIFAPAPGRYAVKCTHFTHAMRGMKGVILVD